MSEKTEQPTPRKLRKAREEGDSAVSSALVQGFGFIVAVALAPAVVEAAGARAAGQLERALLEPAAPISALEISAEVVGLTLPLIAAAAVASAAIGFVQTGGQISTKKLAPDISRANPVKGLKNLLSWQRLIGIARSLVAALVVAYLAVDLLLRHAPDLAYSTGSLTHGGVVAGSVARKLLWIAALVGIALAGIDVLITRYAWLRRHRMSKDEVKREYKESEGDPEIKAARQRAHQEMLAGATLASVKQATVLVVNPTRLAIALKYLEDEDDAPQVLAQGRGELARKMIDAARAYGVPVIRDVPVARALAELEVGDEIPEDLYEAVAEVLRLAWEESEATADEPAED